MVKIGITGRKISMIWKPHQSISSLVLQLTSDEDQAHVDQIRVPPLGLKVGVHEQRHADDALNRVGDAGAGNHPPTDDAQHSNAESCKLLVLLFGDDVGKVVLA